MKTKVGLPILCLGLAALACSLPLPGGTGTDVPTGAPIGEPVPGLSVEGLQNATYQLELCGGGSETFTLTNGTYASGSDPASAGYTQVTMGELTALGDLNYDGVEDAAIILGVNCGGTGVFTHVVAVLNSSGNPTPGGTYFLDDRAQVSSLGIAEGEILVDVLIHSESDPLCCPSFQTQQGFRLYGSTLVRTRLASWTAEGTERSINISSPLELAEAAYPLTVSGNVTIGPFENTLAYYVYNSDNTLVTSGSVMTDSPDMGMPGNFSLAVDLTMAGVFGLTRVEVAELSMRDGSVMTLGSVLVNVH